MPTDEYADRTSGALFVNNRKMKESQPDHNGKLQISKELLRELVDRAKSGGEIKLDLSVWERTSKAGLDYLSINAVISPPEQDDSWDRPRSAPARRENNEDIPF